MSLRTSGRVHILKEQTQMNDKELYRQERGICFILGVKSPRFKNSYSPLGEWNHATHFALSSHLLGRGIKKGPGEHELASSTAYA